MQSLIHRVGNPSYPPAAPMFGMFPPQTTLPNMPFLPPQPAPATTAGHAIPISTPLFTRAAIDQGGLPPAALFTRECGLFSLQPNPLASMPPARQPISPAVSKKTHLIINIDGEEIILDRQQIPADPPAIHLSANVDNLLWEWNHSKRLVIGGKAIPIKCWDQIYKAKAGGESGVWTMIRNEWGN